MTPPIPLGAFPKINLVWYRHPSLRSSSMTWHAVWSRDGHRQGFSVDATEFCRFQTSIFPEYTPPCVITSLLLWKWYITRNLPKSSKIVKMFEKRKSELFKQNLVFLKCILTLKFHKLGVCNIKHNLAGSCFQVCAYIQRIPIPMPIFILISLTEIRRRWKWGCSESQRIL